MGKSLYVAIVDIIVCDLKEGRRERFGSYLYLNGSFIEGGLVSTELELREYILRKLKEINE